MYEWQQIIQTMIDEIDESLINHHSDQRTLYQIAKKLGYSEYYTTRKFKAVTGMSLRDYLKNRKLAFALKAVRDGNQRLLNIALDFDFSSHEAFTRAFKNDMGSRLAPIARILGPLSYEPRLVLLIAIF